MKEERGKIHLSSLLSDLLSLIYSTAIILTVTFPSTDSLMP